MRAIDLVFDNTDAQVRRSLEVGPSGELLHTPDASLRITAKQYAPPTGS